MAVERLVQKIKLGEKRLVQDSMCKLISMIAENKKTQEEIIKALPESEITKMMTFLEDPDPYFRKLTAKFFLDLVYENYAVQQIFCDALGIFPSDGKVCINRVPDSFKRANLSFIECLEILKKVCPEEVKDHVPYCWYFSPENAGHSEKQVAFIFENEKRSQSGLENFIDPLYVMFGFIVKAPKIKKASEKVVEYVERCTSAKDHETRKSAYPANTKVVSSTNNTMNQSLNVKLLNDSQSAERDLPKNASPVKGHSANNVTTASRISYPRDSKPKVNNLVSPVSPAGCNSERLAQHKFGITSERHRDIPFKSSEREINQTIGAKRHSIDNDKIKPLNHTGEGKDKRFNMRESDFLLEAFEQMQNSKVGASMNQSQDFGGKFLETSLSTSMSNKPNLVIRTTEKSPDISQYRVTNEKRSDVSKKTIEKQEKAQISKTKTLESDKRLPKSFRDNNSYSFSATTTPKHTLLSKLLKDKPLAVKEPTSANKQIKTNQDQSKRLNTTTAVSPTVSTKHVPQKFSISFQPAKSSNKSDNEYVNKKNAFHSSLLKSIDMSDHSHGVIQLEEKEESAKENMPHDDVDRKQNSKAIAKSKTYNLSTVLKGSISTPRTPTEALKSTLSQNSKILNARRSHDTSAYLSSLSRDKRKSETSMPIQTLKNRPGDLKDGAIIKGVITEFSLDFTHSTTPKAYVK